HCGKLVELDDSASAWEVCPGCRKVVRNVPAATDADRWKTTSGVLKGQFGILVFFIILAGLIAASGPGPGGESVLCLGSILLLVHFLCLCVSATAPDPAARHSIIACIMTLVLGTVGLFVYALATSPPMNLDRGFIEMTIGFGAFAVYFSAFA